jgi:hypothetical protein
LYLDGEKVDRIPFMGEGLAHRVKVVMGKC